MNSKTKKFNRNVNFETLLYNDNVINWDEDKNVNVSFNAKPKQNIVIVDFNEIALNGTMSYDCLAILHNVSKCDFGIVTFNNVKKSFDDIAKIGFDLTNATKTLGTYSTRCNKIAQNQSPNETQKRNGTTQKQNVSNIGILQNGTTFEFYNVSKMAKIGFVDFDKNKIGFETINDYNETQYFITALFETQKPKPKQWLLNRLGKIVELIKNDKNEIVACQKPHFVMSYNGIEIVNDKNDNETTTKTRLAIVSETQSQNMQNVDFNKIMQLDFVKRGGGEKWLCESFGLNDDFTLKSKPTK